MGTAAVQQFGFNSGPQADLFSPLLQPNYVDIHDLLQATVFSSQTNEVVTITYRLLQAGKINTYNFTVAPGNNRVGVAGNSQAFQTVGYLISFSVTAAKATSRGQTFVRVSLQRNTGVQFLLLADYVTNSAQQLSWPNPSPVRSPLEGPGWIFNSALITPGAGGFILISVPANVRWRLQSLLVTNVTNATVAARQVGLQISGLAASGNILQIPAGATQAASLTYVYNFAAGVPFSGPVAWTGGQSYLTIPLPTPLLIVGTQAIQVDALNKQGTDQFSYQYAVEEFLDV